MHGVLHAQCLARSQGHEQLIGNLEFLFGIVQLLEVEGVDQALVQGVWFDLC